MRTYLYDFNKQEFVRTTTGKFATVEDDMAWLEWCKKAILTERWRYIIYTSDYGQELEDLIGMSLPKSVIESEIQRIITECLKVNSLTESVENFTFKWEGDSVYFTCEVTNINGFTAKLEGEITNG